MEELKSILVFAIIAILFIGLDIWMWFINRRLKREWMRLKEQTQHDLNIIDGEIRRNITILNEIHRLNQQRPDQSERTLTQLIRGHVKLIERISYDDFMDWMDEVSSDQIVSLIPYFDAVGLHEKIRIMKIELENRFSN